jgi:hypothetical protein
VKKSEQTQDRENVENKKHDDTERLLRECNAGIKMGISSIDEVLPSVADHRLRNILEESRSEHADLGDETHELLIKYDCDTKEPHPFVKGMSWLKTGVTLRLDPGDKTVASLMTDGCNMGVKSINGYLNEYGLADSKARKIAQSLIDIEQRMADSLAEFL